MRSCVKGLSSGLAHYMFTSLQSSRLTEGRRTEGLGGGHGVCVTGYGAPGLDALPSAKGHGDRESVVLGPSGSRRAVGSRWDEVAEGLRRGDAAGP